jgi:hypothetical protein
VQPITSRWYWALLGFDLAMRVRNAVWRPPFVMYYRTCPPYAAVPAGKGVAGAETGDADFPAAKAAARRKRILHSEEHRGYARSG